MINYTKHITLFLAIYLLGLAVLAQRPKERSVIDQERVNVEATDKEALNLGRDFVRMDSTYYVGWMYQGLFLNDRSADRLGYQRALPFLRTAFQLIEKEFSQKLQTVFKSIENYSQNYRLYSDYARVTQALRECYEYLDHPDSAMLILNSVAAKNFTRDELGIYGTKAWLIHRNRFYTDGRYFFLAQSVDQNAKLALQSCYDGFAHIKKNEAQVIDWFGPYASEIDRQYLYHYLAMIHGYLQRYDSSEYYYNLMAAFGSISYNNYGSLKHETGEFETAEKLYTIEKEEGAPDKRLREPYYYLPMLNIYAGNTKQSMAIAKEAISFSQSMPGFGWYNIALARAYLYNGQLDSADLVLNKASSFKEVHIGTTLTQPQYDFTIQLLRLVWYNKKITLAKLTDKGWWYKPSKWYEIAALWLKRYAGKYVLARLISENPERERIIYDLFCGESTVTFDEIYAIMDAFSPRFFSNLMESKSISDPRPHIRKYFALGEARMLADKGRNREARLIVNGLLTNEKTEGSFDKLFLARLYEIKARISSGTEKQKALGAMYELFPQLLPFTGQPIQMALQVNGDDKEMVKKVAQGLKQTEIHWKDVASQGVPVASLLIQKKGNKYELTIDTRSSQNIAVVQSEKFVFRPGNNITSEVLLRIFGKSGPIEPDF